MAISTFKTRKGFNIHGMKRCENPTGVCFKTIYEDGFLYASGKYCSKECMGDAWSWISSNRRDRKGTPLVRHLSTN